jgi:hypothetical protein
LIISGGEMPTFISINPFVELSNLVPTMAIQGFLLVMAGLVVGGVLLDIMHKKNVKYFFDNAKKSKRKSYNTCKYR